MRSARAGEPAEVEQIREFVRIHPDSARHVVDLPYRLASHSAQDPANCRLWRDEDGQVVAFALAQQPFWSLDYAVRRDAAGGEIERAVLTWGIERWRDLAESTGQRMFFVDCEARDAARQQMLADLGFRRDSWRQFHLTQPAGQQVSPASLPAGVSIRPLAGEGEVPAYVALHRAAFGSTNMTEAWRRQMLAMPEYRAELDLVAAAPDGQLAAFCIGWLAEVGGRLEGQIEPVGVAPEFQGQGLGRAILLAGLHQLKASGAQVLHIEVDGDNEQARGLYESVGFRVARTFLKFGIGVIRL